LFKLLKYSKVQENLSWFKENIRGRGAILAPHPCLFSIILHIVGKYGRHFTACYNHLEQRTFTDECLGTSLEETCLERRRTKRLFVESKILSAGGQPHWKIPGYVPHS